MTTSNEGLPRDGAQYCANGSVWRLFETYRASPPFHANGTHQRLFGVFYSWQSLKCNMLCPTPPHPTLPRKTPSESILKF
jgi:hypothetical protein